MQLLCLETGWTLLLYGHRTLPNVVEAHPCSHVLQSLLAILLHALSSSLFFLFLTLPCWKISSHRLNPIWNTIYSLGIFLTRLLPYPKSRYLWRRKQIASDIQNMLCRASASESFKVYDQWKITPDLLNQKPGIQCAIDKTNSASLSHLSIKVWEPLLYQLQKFKTSAEVAIPPWSALIYKMYARRSEYSQLYQHQGQGVGFS